MVKPSTVFLILFMTGGCGQSLTPFQPAEPAPDLLKNEPRPELTGDKGKDALTLAEAYVAERCKVLGWQGWYAEYLTASGLGSYGPVQGCE